MTANTPPPSGSTLSFWRTIRQHGMSFHNNHERLEASTLIPAIEFGFEQPAAQN